MLAGIALGLWSMRAALGIELRVACRNDLSTAAEMPVVKPSPAPPTA
jgi:hypothetical protein